MNPALPSVQPFVCPRHLAPGLGQWCKVLRHVAQEPRQPHRFAFAFMANAVHAVIPVARAHQGQAMRACGQTAIDGAGAMLVHRSQGGAGVGRIVSVFGTLGNRCPFNKCHLLIQQGSIARHIHIVRAGKR